MNMNIDSKSFVMTHMGNDVNQPCDAQTTTTPFWLQDSRVVEPTALIDTVSTWCMCTIAIGKITIEQDPILGTNWQRNNIIIIMPTHYTPSQARWE
jgi:hypothetical protein